MRLKFEHQAYLTVLRARFDSKGKYWSEEGPAPHRLQDLYRFKAQNAPEQPVLPSPTQMILNRTAAAIRNAEMPMDIPHQPTHKRQCQSIATSAPATSNFFEVSDDEWLICRKCARVSVTANVNTCRRNLAEVIVVADDNNISTDWAQELRKTKGQLQIARDELLA